MRAPSSFEYAVVRVVPDVERGESVNAGVIVHCRERDFLEARIELDEARLCAVAPWLTMGLRPAEPGSAPYPAVDLELVRRHLAVIPRVCAGGRDAGPIGALPRIERWHWLVAPRSGILQTSPAHAGLDDAPEAALERLVARLVRAAPRSG